MGRPWVTHLKMGNPWVPMGIHLEYCKCLFSNKILSDKMHIGWKLHYFYIYFYKQHCHIGNVSRDIECFLINPQLKCFEIFLIFHGLLLWLLKKIVMKIFINQSQESLEKKFMGTHCNALLISSSLIFQILGPKIMSIRSD
jgi:hypothetical protein